MSNTLVWSSDKDRLKREIEKINTTVFIVVEDCCNHFAGVFATEADAKFAVEGFGEGHSYFETLV